ncbi:MAG: hypothetical protein WCK09_07720 [Bacteroidota bacterium]
MEEKKDKGNSFKRLFFRDAEPPASDTGQTETRMNSGIGNNPVYPSGFSVSGNVPDKTLVEDFVQRLRNHINQSNQPGFDFIEFTETLFEESQNPNKDVYKMVFRIAQKIDRTLTPERLLQSANFYKELIQQAADAEIIKGESKKKTLLAEKETEKNNLDQNLKETRTKTDQLNAQIMELQKKEISLRNQLSAIDQKYNSQFTDIETKLNAINAAKEQVIVSIVDIEAGVKTNL